MRGPDSQQAHMFSYLSPEQRVPQDHPLRSIRQMVDAVLQALGPEFHRLYSWTGRPSIPPEKLLRALLLQILYSVRSERLLMEQLDYNLLFRWFVGMGLEDEVWAHTTFRMNRRRLVASGVVGEFFARCLAHLPGRVLYNGHFSPNLALVEEWNGQMSLEDIDEQVADEDAAERGAGG